MEKKLLNKLIKELSLEEYQVIEYYSILEEEYDSIDLWDYNMLLNRIKNLIKDMK